MVAARPGDAAGGYAEYLTVPAAYAHPLPQGYSDVELAPLLCAGIIGYPALKRAASKRSSRMSRARSGTGSSGNRAVQTASTSAPDKHCDGKQQCGLGLGGFINESERAA